MVRNLSVATFAAILALGAAASLPACAAEAAEPERVVLPGHYAALPSDRSREAVTAPAAEQRGAPAKRERRCTFGIFPQASPRCIA